MSDDEPTRAPGRVTVEAVATASGCEEFIACTSDPDGVERVPLLADDVRAWFRGEHPHVDALTLLLVRDAHGRAVGRCTAHRSAEADRRLRPHLAPGTSGPLLLFGAVAAADEAVLAALVEELQHRAAEAGAAAILGPVSLLPNQLGGTVVDGFAHPGFFDAADNGPTLPQTLERAGFTRWYPAATWTVDVASVPAARRRRPTPAELAAAGVRRVRVRRLRLRGRRGLLERIRTATNASFAALDYFTPLSRRQMARQTSGLEVLMDPRLIIALEEDAPRDAGADRRRRRGGRPPRPLAAFALVVPDPTEVLRAGGGELGPGQLPALLSRRARDAVLIIQAAAPEHQGRGLMSLVSRELFAALRAGGYRRLRVTFIGEENPASAAVFSRAGGEVLHQVCFHVLRISCGPAAPPAEIEDAEDPEDGEDEEDAGSPAARPEAVAGTPEEPPRPTLEQVRTWCAAAARAPSAHNTQPWAPELLTDADGACRGLVLRVAAGRTLPVGDPTGRDLLLGLGAWIESLDVAAGADGRSLEITAVDDDGAPGGAGVVVTLAWRARSGPRRATVDDVRTRRVHRGRLTVPDADGGDLDLPAGFVAIDPRRAAALERRAARHPASSPELVAELLDWLRLDPGHPRWHEDGLSADCLQLPRAVHGVGRLLRGPGGRALRAATVAGLGRLAPPLATAGTGTAVVLRALGGDPEQLLAAGRRLQRCWLALHRRGLAVSPASQVLDHPAAAAAVAALPELAGDAADAAHASHAAADSGPPAVPLAWFRVGVPDDTPPRSARRSAAAARGTVAAVSAAGRSGTSRAE